MLVQVTNGFALQRSEVRCRRGVQRSVEHNLGGFPHLQQVATTRELHPDPVWLHIVFTNKVHQRPDVKITRLYYLPKDETLIELCKSWVHLSGRHRRPPATDDDFVVNQKLGGAKVG